jgi:hypothetical protein
VQRAVLAIMCGALDDRHWHSGRNLEVFALLVGRAMRLSIKSSL